MLMKKNSVNIGPIINIGLLIFMAIITIYPLWYTLMFSISHPQLSKLAGLYLLPYKVISFQSYIKVFSTPQIHSSYFNTFFVVLVGTSISMIITILTAYSISKKDLKGNRFITLFILITMIFSGGMIPTFLVVRQVGLLNSLWSMIIPTAVSAYNTLILRNFFRTIPSSIEESAKIDGCSIPRILLVFVIPLSIPAIATITLFYAVQSWNDFFLCMLYISDSKKYVIQLVLRNLVMEGDSTFLSGRDQSLTDITQVTPHSLRMATIVVATLPIMLVYPFIQKYFIKGVMLGSVKG
jgi:putative aldouronate transport system permease protein